MATMMMVQSPSTFVKAGFACEAFLYCIYTVLFLVSLSFSIRLWRTRGINIPIAIATYLLSVICTVHFGLVCNIFRENENEPGSSNLLSEDIMLLTTVGDFVGDAVLLYRCWLVWDRNYLVLAVPFFSAVSGLVLMAVWMPTTVSPDAFMVTTYSLPLFTHVLLTSLIVGRLYWTSRKSPRFSFSGASHIRTLMNIIIESGMLYVVTQLTLLVLIGFSSPVFEVVLTAAVQVYGIAPTLILLRISVTASIDRRETVVAPALSSFPRKAHDESRQTSDFAFMEKEDRGFSMGDAHVIDISRDSSMRVLQEV